MRKYITPTITILLVLVLFYLVTKETLFEKQYVS